MLKVYRISLVLGVIILTVVGLNISNQGMNSLTADNKKPVLGCQVTVEEIDIFIMGQNYSMDRQEIASWALDLRHQAQQYVRTVAQYLDVILKVIKNMIAYLM